MNAEPLVAETETSGHLAENIAHFGRALRAAGLPVGTGRILNAVRAVSAAGFTRREDFFWTLHACLVSRAEHRAVFERAFALFWRERKALEETLALMGAGLRVPPRSEPDPAGAARAAEAVFGDAAKLRSTTPDGETEFEVDARLTWSSDELLRKKDFEQMTSEEVRRARQLVTRLQLPVPPIGSRRLRSTAQGRIPDWRASMRQSMAVGGALKPPRYRDRAKRGPELVALCDISGSMGSYSRMVLLFLHTVANAGRPDWGRVHSFAFGTRLTNISRWFRTRDVDEALARVGDKVPDWEGGTRIGATLRTFNRDWSRRVLSRGAMVILITDGLDRGEPDMLAREAERLRLASRRVIWLNPLLRWAEFVPRARGVAALLPHVDCFRSVHNLESLESLGCALQNSEGDGEKHRMMQFLAHAKTAISHA